MPANASSWLTAFASRQAFGQQDFGAYVGAQGRSHAQDIAVAFGDNVVGGEGFGQSFGRYGSAHFWLLSVDEEKHTFEKAVSSEAAANTTKNAEYSRQADGVVFSIWLR
ncbi:MAG TPA: hypothetical protein VF800_12410 [Telluria sp.]|jgi:hypothetical protein